MAEGASLAEVNPAKDAVVADAPPASGPRGSVALVGNANVGKSVLFGALTGTYVTVSNYPGTTVEVTHGPAMLAGRRTDIVDTPGSASLLPMSEDERVTRDILLSDDVESVLLVGDARNLERTVSLALQVAEMQVPFVVCLNMMDEAAADGLGVDAETLARRLGVDVVATVAVRREGLARLKECLAHPRRSPCKVPYPAAVEDAVAELEPLLQRTSMATRALALMVLAGDETLVPWLKARLDSPALAALDRVRQELRRRLVQPVGFVQNQSRVQAARMICEGLVTHREIRRGVSAGLVARLDRLTTHPVAGYPVLALVLLAAYLFVGVFGAGTLVGWLEEGFFGTLVNPAAVSFFERFVPWSFVRDLFVGPYGFLTMALTYALALVLPIVGTFFVAFGLLEDSGYLPRLAVMANRLFRVMGLNGKAVLPMVLGLGCDTMATLTTRVLETPKERLIVILLLALGVPCSAQLAVILAMLGALSPWALVLWAGVVLTVIVVVGRLAARVLPGATSDFLIELPPLRRPRLGNIAVKTIARLEWYLKEAVPLFVLGTLVLFAADRLDWLTQAEKAVEPLMAGLVGLPREVAGPFIVGFLRRDFGAAGLFALAREGVLDHTQILVAAVMITLFIPCIANFFMIVKERGLKTAVLVAAFVFPLAVGVGAAFNLLLRTFPGLVP